MDYTHSDQVRGYSRRQLFLWSELLMGRGSRMNHQGLCISNISEMTGQFQTIDQQTASRSITLDTKGKHATKRVGPEELLGKFMRCV